METNDDKTTPKAAKPWFENSVLWWIIFGLFMLWSTEWLINAKYERVTNDIRRQIREFNPSGSTSNRR